jgi:UDP-N-acetylmuramoyl-L-alanyl-D-glutamate--2,6-diaminopimelate ligase
MIESILDASGDPVGLIGTIEYRAGDERLSADRTTPDAVVLQEWFAKMVAAGVKHAVMEVSSHALALERTHGVHFAAAVFTNLSREHFDFHKDFEDYFAAKRILFDQIDRTRKTAVVNIDDEYGRRLADELGDTAITFGRHGEIRPANDFVISVEGLHGTVATPMGDVRVESSLTTAEPLQLARRDRRSAGGHPDRADRVRHSHSAIGAGALRARRRGRRWATRRQQADGDRRLCAQARRAGETSSRRARDRRRPPHRHRLRLRRRPRPRQAPADGRDRRAPRGPHRRTSDNPRSEDPQAIIDEIGTGIHGKEFLKIRDRREAIEKTILEAGEGDVIVIAARDTRPIRSSATRSCTSTTEEAEFALKNDIQKHLDILYGIGLLFSGSGSAGRFRRGWTVGVRRQSSGKGTSNGDETRRSRTAAPLES